MKSILKKSILFSIFLSCFWAGSVSAKSVVSPSDFSFVGGFRLSGISTPRGLTHRYVDGNFYLYTVSINTPNKGHLYQFKPLSDGALGATTNSFPIMTSFTDFGDIFQDKIYTEVNDGNDPNPKEGISGGAQMPRGIFWDETDKRMYWTTVTNYNTTISTSDTSLGYSTLNDSLHTGTGIGMWKISPPLSQGGYGNRWSFSMTAIPSNFAETYLGGRRLGVGFGGGVSIISNGTPSIGPTMFAIAPPDPLVDPNREYLKSTSPIEILSHFNGESKRATRNIAYPGYDVTEGTTGFWFPEDGSRHGVWIDTPDYEGLITFAHIGAGNANTTVTSVASTTVFTVADAGDIARGDYIRIGTDYNPNDHYPFEMRYVAKVVGNTITLESSTTGMIQIGGRVISGGWYAGGGQVISRAWTPWYVYDPSDLANSIVNPTAYPPNQIVPKYNTNVAWPGVDYPLRGVPVGSAKPHEVWGVTFDSNTNRLYLLTYGGYDGVARYNVYVYALNGSTANSKTDATSTVYPPGGLYIKQQ